MIRVILNACALLIFACASASAVELVQRSGTIIDVNLPVPQKMLGVWMLADTGQCANQNEKIIVTSGTIQFGNGMPQPIRFIPHSGAFGGDALHWQISAVEEVLEYDSQNDRMIWQSKRANSATAEYYERCPW